MAVAPLGPSSQGLRRHTDAAMRELMISATMRNEHELAAHGYMHGLAAAPIAKPFHDNDGHRNKTLRWDLQPSS